MKLSENLKTIRKENNLSQEQLAEKLGVSRQAVSKWESDQSYPEMDKVLLICKLYGYGIDELMNENISTVKEEKQSKNNINKYIDDFFAFITKTIDMLSCMKFKQKLKCLFEQIIIGLSLLCVFAIIGAVGENVFQGIFGRIPSEIYYMCCNILGAVYLILAFIIGITILLHIFKVRYLDYYEIIKESDEIDLTKNDNIGNITKEGLNKEENKEGETLKKVFIEKKQEKVIIRDPEHTQSKFLTEIIKFVLTCFKAFAILIGIYFSVTFVILIASIIISFLFIKTGLVFLGTILGIISAILINFIILKILYNFIVSKKNNKKAMALVFITALTLAGISVGTVLLGVREFGYEENYNTEESKYTFEMTDNLEIRWLDNIEYVENNSNDVTIGIKHSKDYIANCYINNNEKIDIHYYHDDSKILKSINNIIDDINNKVIRNYDNIKIYVYSSRENINKIKRNNEKTGNLIFTEDNDEDFESRKNNLILTETNN